MRFQVCLGALLWNRRKLFLLRFARSCVLKHSEVEQNGILKYDTQTVKNCSTNKPMLILPQYGELDGSTICSDCWKVHDVLVPIIEWTIQRINRYRKLLRLCQYLLNCNDSSNHRGTSRKRISCFILKACSACSRKRSKAEFRYNTKTIQENLYRKLLQLIKGLINSKTKFVVKNPLNINWA